MRQPRISIINLNGIVVKNKLIVYNELENSVYIQNIRAAEGGVVMAGFKLGYPGPAWLIKTDSLFNTCWPPNCDSTVTYQLPMEVGINDNQAQAQNIALNIYPNPVYEYFYFSHPLAPMQPGKISLYNTAGKLLLQKPVHSHRDRVNVSHLPTGQYQVILKAVTGQQFEGSLMVIE